MSNRNKKPIIETDINGKFIRFFESAVDAVWFYNNADPPVTINTPLVSDCCRKKVKRAKGKYFRFATPEEIQIFQASLQRSSVIKEPQTRSDTTAPGEVQAQPEESIPAQTTKPPDPEGLTPFQRALRKMLGE